MKSKRILIITAVAALLAASTAFAAYRHHRPAFGLFSPKVVAQLHLTTAQTQSLDAIKAERKALFTQFREQRRTMMAALETTLKSENPDLRALAQQRDAAMDQMRDRMRKIQGDELNLYDSLSPQQKKVVRDSILKRISFMHKHQHNGKQQQAQDSPDSGSF
jgi:Spy/CpxP family protein refolding chaperone